MEPVKCEIRGQRGPRILWERFLVTLTLAVGTEVQTRKLETTGDEEVETVATDMSAKFFVPGGMYLLLSWFRPLHRQTHYNVHVSLVRAQVAALDAWSQFECHIFSTSPGWNNGLEELEWMLGVGLVLFSPHAIISGKMLPTSPPLQLIIITKEQNTWSASKAINKSWLLYDRQVYLTQRALIFNSRE